MYCGLMDFELLMVDTMHLISAFSRLRCKTITAPEICEILGQPQMFVTHV